jgi:hypothetical protein
MQGLATTSISTSLSPDRILKMAHSLLHQSSLRPFLMLDERDDVGADVYPWPPSPMALLDVQKDAMKFGKIL